MPPPSPTTSSATWRTPPSTTDERRRLAHLTASPDVEIEDGFVDSDYGATHSTVASANTGLDQELPSAAYYAPAGPGNLKHAVLDGSVPRSTVDEHARRILAQMFRFGLFDRQPTGTRASDTRNDWATGVAGLVNQRSAVLLKNAGSILPLGTATTRRLAVIGMPAIQGGGSSTVATTPGTVVTPLSGITARAAGTAVAFAEGAGRPLPFVPGALVPGEYTSSAAGVGLTGRYFNGSDPSGTPVLTRNDVGIDFDWGGSAPGPGVGATNWSAEWTGTLRVPAAGAYTFTTCADDGARLWLGGAPTPVIDDWPAGGHGNTCVTSAAVQLAAGSLGIRLQYHQLSGGSDLHWYWGPPAGVLRDEAVSVAGSSDAAVVFASDFESEAFDRADLSLGADQNDLIAAVAAAQPNTVVVLTTGSAVTMPWLSSVRGVIEDWYGGEQLGSAIAAVLYGDVNPSGHLPLTFPAREADAPAHTPAQWPGTGGSCPSSGCVTSYSEGLDVGYRWYDSQGIAPLFPFGFGLSYTTFAFSGLSVSGLGQDGTVTVRARVANTGARDGSDAAQLYLSMPASAGEPLRQLAGFQVVSPAAGQSADAVFSVPLRSLAYYDVGAHDWIVPSGTYTVSVGDSSRNLPLRGTFTLANAYGPGLPTTFSNSAVSDESAPGGANLDGIGESLSAQALAAAGIRPGQPFAHDGLTFTWPSPAPGLPDDTLASGQTVTVRGSGPTLGVVGLSAFGSTSGTLTVHFTDGTRKSYPLTFPDWWGTGADVVASLARYDTPSGVRSDHPVNVYGAAFALPARKVVASVTLPAVGGSVGSGVPSMHVFAIAVGGTFPSLGAAFDDAGSSDDGAAGAGDLDAIGNTLSLQSLAADGLGRGQSFTDGGITYTWPGGAAGSADNALANGQTVPAGGMGARLGVVGLSTFGATSGTLTVRYTDGTASTFTLTLADWSANAPAGGEHVLRTMSRHTGVPDDPATGYHSAAAGGRADSVSLHAQTFALAAGKTVAGVTLPAGAAQGVDIGIPTMHVFAIGIG